ncbi:MAG TPA: ABC transporter ATP-binding protein, partial [Actinoplanes sp.]|nr:ABC transporter ATP-binding protein [Actinoplanes sp.]
RVRVEAGADLPAAYDALVAAGARVSREADHLMVGDIERPAAITRLLAEHKIYVSELTPVAADLESVFLQLTGTTPVAGEHRQVDQSVVPAATSASGQGSWGV